MLNLQCIHSDERGTISILTGMISVPEVTIFETKDGFARGGCIHKQNKEMCCIIEGSINYQIGSQQRILMKGDTVIIPSNTPHFFTSLGDSIVIEWGASPDEKKTKHPEFRSVVDRINKERLECGDIL